MENVITKSQSALEKRMLAVGMDKEAIARELSFASQLWNGSEQLQKADPNSILAAVVNVANIGLTLNPAAKEAYMISRWNSKKQINEISLQAGYIGLIRLMTDSGAVKSVMAHLVYENDQFTYEPTGNDPVKHVPQLKKSARGEVIGAYALATLADGRKQAEWMDTEEINDVRDTSDSYKNEKTRSFSPWEKHWGEMARKTVLRRLYKYLPRSTGNSKADAAMNLLDQEYGASIQQRMAIDQLLASANISPEKINLLDRRNQTGDISQHEAGEIIEELKENQAPPIDPQKQFKANKP